MSPENANVFLVDDEASWTRTARKSLIEAGHKVPLEATDVNSAYNLIARAQELGINVAVLDGNLTGMDFNCNEARRIADALKAQIPEIKIVALGSERADFGKARLTKLQIPKLGEIVKSL